MLVTSKLRPGLLVHLATSIRGNVSYQRLTTEPAHTLENGETTREQWETTKTVTDAAEHASAIQVRGKCRSLVTAVCASSPNGGLLCLQQNRDKLDAAITEARAMAESFNATAGLTRISVNVWIGEIMADDVEAMRSINKDMRDLLADMESGVKNLDVAAIRDAANKAKSISTMLTPDAQKRMESAIEAVRAQARKIVKAGEVASAEIDQTIFNKLAVARTEFLDIDIPQGDIGEVRGAAVAVELSPVQTVASVPMPQPAIKLE